MASGRPTASITLPSGAELVAMVDGGVLVRNLQQELAVRSCGAHDLRHTFATWLEGAGILARVIDEVMGHEATSRVSQQRGSAMGATTHHPEDGHPGHRRRSATTDARTPGGRRVA